MAFNERVFSHFLVPVTICFLSYVFYFSKIQQRRIKQIKNNASRVPKRIFVATRIHEKKAVNPTDIRNVLKFCQRSVLYGDHVAIAVCAETDGGGADLVRRVEEVVFKFREESGKQVEVIPVQPWGSFVPALNALLARAAKSNCETLLFQSLETVLDKSVAVALEEYLDEDHLVVGASLPGHEFKAGKRVLDGCTTPWNTLALWSVKKLAVTGFLAISDGLLEGIEAGIEEACVITLHQHIKPQSSKATLLKLPQIKWETDWSDQERCQWHAKKMESKKVRAQAQLSKLGLANAFVTHKHMDLEGHI